MLFVIDDTLYFIILFIFITFDYIICLYYIFVSVFPFQINIYISSDEGPLGHNLVATIVSFTYTGFGIYLFVFIKSPKQSSRVNQQAGALDKSISIYLDFENGLGVVDPFINIA